MSFQLFALLAALLVVTVTANPQCSRPYAPRYGYIRDGRKHTYHTGSVIIFKCNRGYRMSGYGSSTCLSRGNNAYWNQKVPICIKIIIKGIMFYNAAHLKCFIIISTQFVRNFKTHNTAMFH